MEGQRVEKVGNRKRVVRVSGVARTEGEEEEDGPEVSGSLRERDDRWGANKIITKPRKIGQRHDTHRISLGGISYKQTISTLRKEGNYTSTNQIGMSSI